MRRERFFITMLSAFLMLLFAVFALLLLERGTELGLSMVERKMKLRAELELDKTRDEIETELQSHLEREVSTVEIGEMVMSRIRKVDEVAYVRFASVYRSFKDINTFMEELSKLLSDKSS